ncbi:MAG: PAS domain-containing protein, partial [Desulfovibrionaceae bacterium]
ADVVRENGGAAAWGVLLDLTAWKRLEATLLESKSELEDSVLDRSQRLEESSRRLEQETAFRAVLEQDRDLCARMVSVSTDALACLDRAYIYRAANSAYERLAGASAEEIIGRRPQDVLGRDMFLNQIKPYLDKALAGREVRRQGWYDTPGRGRLCLDVVYSPFRSAEGKAEGVLVSIRDVTESRLARDALEASERRLRQAQAVAGIGSFGRDVATGEGHWSEELYRLLGYEPGEVRPTHQLFRQHVHPEDKALVDRAVRAGERGDAPFDMTFRYFKKEGELRWARVQARVERDDRGQAERILGTFHDITAHKGVEERIARERQRMSALLDLLPHAVHLQAPDYSIPYCNGRFQELFGPPGGRPCYEVLHGRSEPCEPCPTFRVFETGEACCWEWGAPDGRSYEVHDLPFTDPDGTPLVLELALDVTEQARIKQELVDSREASEAANRDKSLFLAGVSHEIRSPLNGLLGMLQVLEMTELDEEQRECVETARISGKSLLAVIGDLLDLSRIESGKVELAQAPFDPAGEAAEALRVLRPQAEAKGLRLEAELAEVPVLRGDATRLRQILFNLAGNAVKFTEQGRVRVKLWAEPADAPGWSMLHIEVLDTGPGVSEAFLPRAFEPFAREFDRKKGGPEGSGLGLGIVKSLVQRMDGDISLTSPAGEGVVARLHLRLPVAGMDENALEARNAPDRAAGPGWKLLVVEDDRVNRLSMTRLLQKRGHEVTDVETGREALEVLARERFDCVLLDIQLPEMDGLELARRIRSDEALAANRTTRLLAVTAHAMGADGRRIMDAGMDGVVAKPLEVKALSAALDRVMQGRMA